LKEWRDKPLGGRKLVEFRTFKFDLIIFRNSSFLFMTGIIPIFFFLEIKEKIKNSLNFLLDVIFSFSPKEN